MAVNSCWQLTADGAVNRRSDRWLVDAVSTRLPMAATVTTAPCLDSDFVSIRQYTVYGLGIRYTAVYVSIRPWLRLCRQIRNVRTIFRLAFLRLTFFRPQIFVPQFFVSHFFVSQFFVSRIFVWQFFAWIFFRLNYFSSAHSSVCVFFRSYIFFVRTFFRSYIFRLCIFSSTQNFVCAIFRPRRFSSVPFFVHAHFCPRRFSSVPFFVHGNFRLLFFVHAVFVLAVFRLCIFRLCHFRPCILSFVHLFSSTQFFYVHERIRVGVCAPSSERCRLYAVGRASRPSAAPIPPPMTTWWWIGHRRPRPKRRSGPRSGAAPCLFASGGKILSTESEKYHIRAQLVEIYLYTCFGAICYSSLKPSLNRGERGEMNHILHIGICPSS